MIDYTCYTSSIEPKNIKEALGDEYWVIATQDELEKFTRNEVWNLVLRLKDENVSRTT